MTHTTQVLSDEQIAEIGAEQAPYTDFKFARAIESATLAALGGQPVAWRWMPSQEFPMWVYSDDKARVMEALRFMGHGGVQPLYTLPPAQPAPAPVDERHRAVAVELDRLMLVAPESDGLERVATVYVYRLSDGRTQVRAPDIQDSEVVVEMLQEALRAMSEGSPVQIN